LLGNHTPGTERPGNALDKTPDTSIGAHTAHPKGEPRGFLPELTESHALAPRPEIAERLLWVPFGALLSERK